MKIEKHRTDEVLMVTKGEEDIHFWPIYIWASSDHPMITTKLMPNGTYGQVRVDR